MKIKYLTLLFLHLFLPFLLFAQFENHTWFFGDASSKAGFKFNVETNELEEYNDIRYPINLMENIALVSNPSTGIPLFYSNGVEVVDQQHTRTPNGTNLLGSGSSLSGVTIVMDPINCDKYFLFTTPSIEGQEAKKIHYSIFDAALQGNGTIENPFGDIDSNVKNVDLTPTGVSCAEGILSIKKSGNTKESWVLFGGTNNRTLYILDVSETGISIHNSYNLDNLMPTIPKRDMSFIKMDYQNTSINNGLLVLAPGYDVNDTRYPVGIANFNTATGTIDENSYEKIDNTSHIYGITFSPDATKIYYSDYANKTLIQYDISNKQLTTIGNSPHTGRTGGLETGPDGKIYWLNMYYNQGISLRTLSVVNSPNLSGLDCDLALNEIPITSNIAPIRAGTFPSKNSFPMSPQFVSISNTSDYKTPNGSATLHHGEFPPPYTYNWDNGETTETAVALSKGTHYITFTDGTGCQKIYSVEIGFSCSTTNANTLIINDQPIPEDDYITSTQIISTGIVESNTQVNFIASQDITLKAGFHSKSNSNFFAKIDDCSLSNNINLQEVVNKSALERLSNNYLTPKSNLEKNISIFPNPTSDNPSINFQLVNDEKTSISIYNLSGQLELLISQDKFLKHGSYSIHIDINSLKSGLYIVVLSTASQINTKRMVVIK